MTRTHILTIDQGTTSTRAVVFDRNGRPLGSAALEIQQHYPRSGWVEHDVQEIWKSVTQVVPQALAAARVEASALAAIGLTNQRETTVLWDRDTSRPVHRAIVWQDRRTADFCREHKADEPWLHERTGLVLDPYFSATKVLWLLQQDAQLRAAAEAGRICFGNVDSLLIWRLTGGKVHATDVTNASRTLLLNLREIRWDPELCSFFAVPQKILPAVQPSAADFGVTHGLDFLPDGLPICGVAGDQQAALFGQRCFAPGEAKCTYGTGAFFLLHTGNQPVASAQGLLTTLAATIGNQPQYALEGSVFIAGAAVQWLRDGLRLITSAEQTQQLAEQSAADSELIFVPALVGLGAPHWTPEARGTLFGITRATSAADLARAVIEGVAFQVVDLIEAAVKESGIALRELQADGGMARNDFFMRLQADLLGRTVVRDIHTEATALGAAFLAGLQAGIWPDTQALRGLPRTSNRFEPSLPEYQRRRLLRRWQTAVATVVRHYREQASA